DGRMRKGLSAVDEMCGFVTAVAYERPKKLAGMGGSSVRKKMKQKSFAAAVKREDIEKGAELLGLPLDDHINHVIAAMQAVSAPLGFGEANDSGGTGATENGATELVTSTTPAVFRRA